MPRTAQDIRARKGGEKIAAVTAYDFTMATLLDRAGIEILLVGDSAAMVMMGHESTQGIGMDEMCMFTSSVAAAQPDALVVADMPLVSCQGGVEVAAAGAARLASAGAGAVKIEGGAEVVEHVKRIVGDGIEVMGHLGFLPQTEATPGASKRRGTSEQESSELVEHARALEEAGAFSLVLEMVSTECAARVTEAVGIPTVGIGSGPACDGQVLVGQDMLGMYERIKPSFAKRYLDLADQITAAAREYKDDILSGAFPAEKHGFSMGDGAR